jgi:uncharacterized metal-binding protein YceD (DUF177 family)
MDGNPMTPEFSQTVPLSEIGDKAVRHKLLADEVQRTALAKRFDLLSLETLSAEVDLASDGEAISVKGKLVAQLSQACVITGTPVPAHVTEHFDVRFVADIVHESGAELEIEADECETMFHDGRVIDLGEAVAQTLGLVINPYPRSPDADVALKKAGVKAEYEAGPFAALAALRKDISEG